MFIAGDAALDELSVIAGSTAEDQRRWTGVNLGMSNGWGQGWKLFIIDPLNTGTLDTGTYDPGDISVWGLWIDTDVSVRSDTVFVDQVAIAHGIEAHSGTGSLQDIIDYEYGTLATRVIGSITYKGRFNYATGPMYIGSSTDASSDTILTATNRFQVVVFAK